MSKYDGKAQKRTDLSKVKGMKQNVSYYLNTFEQNIFDKVRQQLQVDTLEWNVQSKKKLLTKDDKLAEKSDPSSQLSKETKLLSKTVRRDKSQPSLQKPKITKSLPKNSTSIRPLKNTETKRDLSKSSS